MAKRGKRQSAAKASADGEMNETLLFTGGSSNTEDDSLFIEAEPPDHFPQDTTNPRIPGDDAVFESTQLIPPDATGLFPPTDPFAERRNEDRVSGELTVEYESFDDFVVAYTDDISRGGLFISTEMPLPIQTLMRLRLVLPNDGPTVNVIARVAYNIDVETADRKGRKAGMGVEFVEVEGGPLSRQLEAYFTLHLGAEAMPDTNEAVDILIVEDGSKKSWGQDILAGAGHRINTAATGLEALGKVLASVPAAIILPVRAEVMDGWQLLHILRERPSVAHVPVMLLDSHTSPARRVRAYRHGADDYVELPVTDEELHARVVRLIARGQNTGPSGNALRGEISQIPLTSVLSFIEVERRSGTLLVVHDKSLAKVHIQNGNPIDVEMQPESEHPPGIERLYQVLDWETGQFELSTENVERDATIEMSTGMALMEHARIRDEESRHG